MKLTNRQLVMSSLKPLLVCMGMYCVILFVSVFVCSSIYHAVKAPKKMVGNQATTATTAALHQAGKTQEQSN